MAIATFFSTGKNGQKFKYPLVLEEWIGQWLLHFGCYRDWQYAITEYMFRKCLRE